MTAAEMRKMMEGVVLFGTGKRCAAQRLQRRGQDGDGGEDRPRTRTYSKTKFVASFVGFAPVNNPAVTIAVIMDSPDHSMHFGAEASATCLSGTGAGDSRIPGCAARCRDEVGPLRWRRRWPGHGPQEHVPEMNENVEELFAEVNNLPADDPLRSPQPAESQTEGGEPSPKPTSASAPVPAPLNEGKVPTVQTQAPAVSPAEASGNAPLVSLPAPSVAPAGSGSVVVDSTRRVAVPSFLGQGVRHVIEQAGTSGLAVEVVGNGLAREQAPSPGTMVPAGTEIVVKFTR
jgi:cell division protein FtsI (penicillin-binding protein 3)